MAEKDVLQDEEPKKGKGKKVELALEDTPAPEPAPEPNEAPKKVMSRQELDLAGAITVAQFLRSENLGYMKQGFAIYIRDKGIGGRKPRKEWMDMFVQYKQAPAAAFKQRRGK